MSVRPSVTHHEAAAELRAAGFEPLQPYPGTVKAAWPARCTTCKRQRRPTLGDIRAGQRCKHRQALYQKYPRVDPDQAERELLEAGYEPLEPYPGSMSRLWLVRCTTCKTQRQERLGDIHSGRRRCDHTSSRRPPVSAAQAERELREAGCEPLEPYPGKALAPWPARCTTCGHRYRLRLSSVRAGRTCCGHPRQTRPSGGPDPDRP